MVGDTLPKNFTTPPSVSEDFSCRQGGGVLFSDRFSDWEKYIPISEAE
jgi:hypothetical protein